MKLLDSIIQCGVSMSEQYATARSATYALRMNGTTRPEDVTPLQHPQSNGPVSEVFREASRAASELLPTDASALRETNAATLDKAGAAVQRAVSDAAMGNAHNLAFALKMQSDARADAISTISADIGKLASTPPPPLRPAVPGSAGRRLPRAASPRRHRRRRIRRHRRWMQPSSIRSKI